MAGHEFIERLLSIVVRERYVASIRHLVVQESSGGVVRLTNVVPLWRA